MEDLADFGVDLTWAASDIDLFLNDTQYLQLGDHLHPHPQPAAHHDSRQPQQNVEPTSPNPTSVNAPHAPPNNSSTHASARKHVSPTPATEPVPVHSPIRIAPRAAASPATDPEQQQTGEKAVRVHTADKAQGVQRAHMPVTSFPHGIAPGGMLPVINMSPSMYPMHQQPVFPSSSTAISPVHAASPSDAPSSAPKQTQPSPRPDPNSVPVPKPHVSATPHAPFMSPHMQLLPQALIPYDPSMMFQIYASAAAAAAAGYPHTVIPVPPVPQPNAPNIHPRAFNPYVPGSQRLAASDGHAPVSTAESAPMHRPQSDPQPSGPALVPANRPILVSEEGTPIVVSQQAAARLERHPVLGRLQLTTKNSVKATSSSAINPDSVNDSDSQQRVVEPGTGYQSSPPPGKNDSRHGSSVDGELHAQKKRLVWTPELHERFVKAIDAVGLNHAVPKTLITIMNVDGLTTEHVKSHLQKYRNSLRKEAAEEARERERKQSAEAATGATRQSVMGVPLGASAKVASDAAATSSPRSSVPVISHGPFQVLPNRINVFGAPVQNVARGTLVGAPVPGSTPGHIGASAPVWAGNTAVRHVSPQQMVGRMSDSRAQQSPIAALAALQQSDGDGAKVTRPVPNEARGKSAPSTAAKPESKNQAGSTGAVDLGTGAGATMGRVLGGALEQQMSTGASASGDCGSSVQGRRDLELELMKERTLQMQLQLQMVVHRTIAMEKKLEQAHSERMHIEASGGRAASGRSTVGNAVKTDSEMRDVENAEGGQAENRREAGGTVKEGDKVANGISNRAKRRRTGENEPGSELKALLSDQLGLRRELEATTAMIDEHMKGEETGKNEAASGSNRDDGNRTGGEVEGSGPAKCSDGTGRGSDGKEVGSGAGAHAQTETDSVGK